MLFVSMLLTLTAWGTPECPDGYRHVAPYCIEVSQDVQVSSITVETWSGSGVERWRPWLNVYFYPWEVERALQVMRCESGGDPYAINPTSGASGLFQHMPRYWSERSLQSGWGGYGIMNVDANIAVAAYLVHRDGWWHWSQCL